ncbi:MAG: hypothetical protein LCH63_00635 [Candidatus Melainabacteria bacterium]|jgi:hypothetical protein|nr:hypothetical protein [Candidatus Melainabacteria bacterium]OPZ88414.1 MAG: hypothetical protein BWY75_01615 [bacterium ADurb.Bin425]
MQAIFDLFEAFHEMAVFSTIALILLAVAVIAVLLRVFKSDFSQID